MDRRYNVVIPRRVSRGAAFMDRTYPGWFTRIQLENLIMKSGTACIIGQHFGDYVEAIPKVKNEAGIEWEGQYNCASLSSAPYIWHEGWEVSHGFLCPDRQYRNDEDEYGDDYYAALEKCWEMEIQDRLIKASI